MQNKITKTTQIFYARIGHLRLCRDCCYWLQDKWEAGVAAPCALIGWDESWKHHKPTVALDDDCNESCSGHVPVSEQFDK